MTLSVGSGNQALLQSFTDYFADTVFIVNYEPGDTFVINYATHSFLEKINKTFDEVINAEIAQVFPEEEAVVLRTKMVSCIAHATENNFK